MNKIANYSVQSASNRYTVGSLCLLRLGLVDDLDFSLRTVKDTLMSHKFKDDSLLIEKEYGSVVRVLSIKYANIKSKLNTHFMFHRDISNELSKLKKACLTENDLNEQYRNNLEKYSERVDAYNVIIRGYIYKYSKIKHVCKRQIKPSRKELKAYIKEKEIEGKMYSVRSRYINAHYNALSNVNKRQIHQVEILKGKNQNLRSRYFR
jgi:hypothetical protein